jgi:hypothetical protein
MRFSMSIGPGEPAPPPPTAPGPDGAAPGGLSPDAVAAAELRLLEAQLERMRGMLFGYSSLFFATIRNWTFLSIGLLVLGWSGILPAAVVPVPFIVPFAFLETGYLFWYTVFARRHAERLEQAINERLGRDVLVAHRLEAAYFYAPDAPKIAALSFGNPAGFMGAMTIGYSAGAALVWLAGLVSTNAFIHDNLTPGFGPSLPETLVVPLAVAWTLVIAGYLAWTFLRRPDEERFLAVLRDAYRLPQRPAVAAPPEPAVPEPASDAPAGPEPEPPAVEPLAPGASAPVPPPSPEDR